MANVCSAQVSLCHVRVARLEANGVPDPGANNLYNTDTFAIVTFGWDVEEGEEVVRKNGCGDLCINYKDHDRYKRITMSVELCVPNPRLMEMLAGGNILTSGAEVGYAYPALGVDPTPYGVSIEGWSKRVNVDGSQDATAPWAWWVWPRVYLRHGDKTLENGPQNTTLEGWGIENDNWFDGPDNTFPVDSDRAAQWIPTNTIPVASCDYATTAVS